MGAWSEDIIGSDAALDTLGTLGHLIKLPGDVNQSIGKISMYPLPNPSDQEKIGFISGALIQYEAAILGRCWYRNQWPVIATAYLSTGTPMPEKVIDHAIRACSYEIANIRDFTWVNPKARVKILKNHIALIGAHEPGKISPITHKGLFQVMEEKGNRPKIHIDDLFAAFQKFQSAQRTGISSVREPGKWQAAMDKAAAEFKKEIGDLAQHIDWTKRD